MTTESNSTITGCGTISALRRTEDAAARHQSLEKSDAVSLTSAVTETIHLLRGHEMRFTFVGVFLLVFGSPTSSSAPLTIRVTPVAAMEPASVRVRTTIEANASNRGLRVVTESDSFYRASEIPLEGERAPRTSDIFFKDLPAGEYDVTVTLIGPGGPLARDWRRLTVAGAEELRIRN